MGVRAATEVTAAAVLICTAEPEATAERDSREPVRAELAATAGTLAKTATRPAAAALTGGTVVIALLTERVAREVKEETAQAVRRLRDRPEAADMAEMVPEPEAGGMQATAATVGADAAPPLDPWGLARRVATVEMAERVVRAETETAEMEAEAALEPQVEERADTEAAQEDPERQTERMAAMAAFCFVLRRLAQGVGQLTLEVI